jgi:hypothetical protein
VAWEVRVLDEQRPDMEHFTTGAHETLKDGGGGLRAAGGVAAYSQVWIVVEPLPGSIGQIFAAGKDTPEHRVWAVQVAHPLGKRRLAEPTSGSFRPS